MMMMMIFNHQELQPSQTTCGIFDAFESSSSVIIAISVSLFLSFQQQNMSVAVLT